MSTQVDNLRRLAAIAERCRELEAATSRLIRVRDDWARELRRDGVSAIELASTMGITRARVYVVVEGPVDDDDPAADDFYERAAQLWEQAEQAWEANDHQGDPDDYFPLREFVDAR